MRTLKNGVFCLTLVYVDDVIVVTKSVVQKVDLFKLLNKQYGTKDHGRATQYLGVESDRSDSSYCLPQTQYTLEGLERFGFTKTGKVGNPVDCTSRYVHEEPETRNDMVSYPNRVTVRNLMYRSTSTRPDISFEVGLLGRFVSNSSCKHVGAVKRVFRYFSRTLE